LLELIKRGSRVVHQLLNKTRQKLSVILSKRGPTASLEKGGRLPSSPPLISTLALIYMQKKDWLHSTTVVLKRKPLGSLREEKLLDERTSSVHC